MEKRVRRITFAVSFSIRTGCICNQSVNELFFQKNMQQKIKSVLISVFNKDGLQPIIASLTKQNITIYSTGGTQKFIEENGGKCISVESLTGYPSILGGRVKTLHPSVFGGILGRRDLESDVQEMEQYKIPEIDLVIVDLYPLIIASTSQ